EAPVPTSYVLVTAAYNEEQFIAQTIEAVIAQTVLPKKWVIVSDASSDSTDQIVQSYAQRHPFIHLHRIVEAHPRNFAAQVNAINAGHACLAGLDFAFIGNLDADVAFDPSYFERLLERFISSPELGLAGGFIHERHRGSFRARPTNSTSAVAHAVQLFRRECYDGVGGYTPLKYGGPDWFAEVRARQQGWTVRSYPDLPVQHFRPTAGAEGVLRGRLRQGRMDYSFGTLPAFELLKCAARVSERPVLLGAAARLAAFIFCCLKREPLLVPHDFAHHLRAEQQLRLRAMCSLNFHNPAKQRG
ncbi:MAG: glycosyltransferase family A protein, partial [Acidobacteriaceae bacterium]